MAPVTKAASTIPSTADIAGHVDEALRIATAPHRGPVFLDVAVDELFSAATSPVPRPPERLPLEPDPEDLARVATLLHAADRPVLVLGGDVWADGAEDAARRLAETLGLPVIANGMGRGILPAGHPLLVTRARGMALGAADLVLVAGTPLDFRLGFGQFGGRGGNPSAAVVHLVDSPGAVAAHVKLDASAAGDLTLVLDGILAAATGRPGRLDPSAWLGRLQDKTAATLAADAELLAADTDPIHPARIYGELIPRLEPDAIVIGDGGDFVSFAGRFVEPRQPGCWMDPGPYGCLGTGLGYAMGARVARPSAQIALMLGDGAAGFSLMDVDTLVRHRMPVVMIVGNNGIWGLEKHPMQALYGWDVAADLQPQCRYDEVVRALGGAGELVTRPADIGPALDRAFASGVPYLVNVSTDPAVAYPRSTML